MFDRKKLELGLTLLAFIFPLPSASAFEAPPVCGDDFKLNRKTCICELKATANPFAAETEQAAVCREGGSFDKEKCLCSHADPKPEPAKARPPQPKPARAKTRAPVKAAAKNI